MNIEHLRDDFCISWLIWEAHDLIVFGYYQRLREAELVLCFKNPTFKYWKSISDFTVLNMLKGLLNATHMENYYKMKD